MDVKEERGIGNRIDVMQCAPLSDLFVCYIGEEQPRHLLFISLKASQG
jgi:hypothetical protein